MKLKVNMQKDDILLFDNKKTNSFTKNMLSDEIHVINIIIFLYKRNFNILYYFDIII